MPATSATAVADMPAKIMLAITFTWPSPPRMKPTRALAKSKIRALTEPTFIRLAARMKNGIARIGKLFSPRIICRANSSGRRAPRPPSITTTARQVRPIDTAIGTPTANSTTIRPRKMTR